VNPRYWSQVRQPREVFVLASPGDATVRCQRLWRNPEAVCRVSSWPGYGYPPPRWYSVCLNILP